MEDTQENKRQAEEKILDWLSNQSILNLKSIVPTTAREYSLMHPKEMRETTDRVVKAIETATLGKYRKKMSRVRWELNWERIFLEFGQWSHVFNKELRQLIKINKVLTDDEAVMDLYNKYCYVYAYWWNRMHYVSTILSSKSRLSGASMKKGIERGRQTLTRLINGEIDLTQIHHELRSLIASLQSEDYAIALQETAKK